MLLQGESGTGKDLAAESIHLESARRDGPFVVVDCGAIPGTCSRPSCSVTRRARSPARPTRASGAFEAAAGGTLLLDEIGELALELQPKLLRALERREIQRVGSTQRIARRRAHHRRDQPRPQGRGQRAPVPLRPLLPARRARRAHAAAARAHRRHPDARRAILDALGDRTRRWRARSQAASCSRARSATRWPGNVRELRNYVEALPRAPGARARRRATARAGDRRHPAAARGARSLDRATSSAATSSRCSSRTATTSAPPRAPPGVDRVHLHRLARCASGSASSAARSARSDTRRR